MLDMSFKFLKIKEFINVSHIVDSVLWLTLELASSIVSLRELIRPRFQKL